MATENEKNLEIPHRYPVTMYVSNPISNILHRCDSFVIIDELHWHIKLPEFRVYLRVHSGCCTF